MVNQQNQGPQDPKTPARPGVDDLYAGRYLAAENWSLGNKELEITGVGIENLKGMDGKSPQAKVTIELEECRRPLVVNKTNYQRISAAYGKDPTLWIGRMLFVAAVDKEVAGRIVKGYTLSPVTS